MQGGIEHQLTGPGCNLNPASWTLESGRSSLPPIGGFSINDLSELQQKLTKFQYSCTRAHNGEMHTYCLRFRGCQSCRVAQVKRRKATLSASFH